jgi:hypothetical protein
MKRMNNGEIMELAERLATRLREDIQLARTRDEHIRVTARANEAAELLTGLRERVSNP